MAAKQAPKARIEEYTVQGGDGREYAVVRNIDTGEREVTPVQPEGDKPADEQPEVKAAGKA